MLAWSLYTGPPVPPLTLHSPSSAQKPEQTFEDARGSCPTLPQTCKWLLTSQGGKADVLTGVSKAPYGQPHSPALPLDSPPPGLQPRPLALLPLPPHCSLTSATLLPWACGCSICLECFPKISSCPATSPSSSLLKWHLFSEGSPDGPQDSQCPTRLCLLHFQTTFYSAVYFTSLCIVLLPNPNVSRAFCFVH